MNNHQRKYMFVKIPLVEQHEGWQSCVKRIRISAFCPKCGAPRGKVFSHNMRSYDGSLWVTCDGWKNPCGHVDYYNDVRKEYFDSLKMLKEKRICM